MRSGGSGGHGCPRGCVVGSWERDARRPADRRCCGSGELRRDRSRDAGSSSGERRVGSVEWKATGRGRRISRSIGTGRYGGRCARMAGGWPGRLRIDCARPERARSRRIEFIGRFESVSRLDARTRLAGRPRERVRAPACSSRAHAAAFRGARGPGAAGVAARPSAKSPRSAALSRVLSRAGPWHRRCSECRVRGAVSRPTYRACHLHARLASPRSLPRTPRRPKRRGESFAVRGRRARR